MKYVCSMYVLCMYYVCMYVCMYVRMGAGLTGNEALVLVDYDYSRVTENEHNLFSNT